VNNANYKPMICHLPSAILQRVLLSKLILITSQYQCVASEMQSPPLLPPFGLDSSLRNKQTTSSFRIFDRHIPFRRFGFDAIFKVLYHLYYLFYRKVHLALLNYHFIVNVFSNYQLYQCLPLNSSKMSMFF
jgi:hypothetical protein